MGEEYLSEVLRDDLLKPTILCCLGGVALNEVRARCSHVLVEAQDVVRGDEVDDPRRRRYTITFDTVGGSGIDPITEDYGTVLYGPENPPTKDHYTFAGWVPSVSDTMPAENLTVKATWTPKRYQIKFETGEGSPVSAIEDVYGVPIVAPADPTWEGHVFVGWTDDSGDVVALPSYMLDNDPPLTFKAKWKSVQSAPQLEVQVVDARSAKVEDPVAGAEYVIVPAGQAPGAKDWANAKFVTDGKVVFEGLSTAAFYDVWARMSEADEAAQSEAAKVTVTTPKEQQEAPSSGPNAWAVNPTTVAVEQGSGSQEYTLVPKGSQAPAADPDAWKSPGGDGRIEWSGLEPNTEYEVYARMKGSDTKEPSGPSPATTVKTPAVTVTNVVLNSESVKKVYVKGEALDAGGLTLEITKSDGSTQTVDVTADMVSGFDGNTVGTQMLTVVYEGFTNTYEVEVREVVPPVVTYTVTVANGTGGGSHAEGESVTIVAGESAARKRFKEWTSAASRPTAS